MLKHYLNENLYSLIINNFNFNEITEIRMRLNKRIIVVSKNKKYFLKDSAGNYVIVNDAVLDNFIRRITENSIYAFNDKIIDGYISLPNGVRVGLCGEVVINNDKVSTIKNFSSVNIRIPHVVKNCSLLAYDYITENNFKNTLIVSAPGCGKTTFLRDLIYQMHVNNLNKNILIVDERNEICINSDDKGCPYIGDFCDVYTNCSKSYAFFNGIRSMSPDVILTDELNLEKDLDCVVNAINSGVNVIATIHAKNLEQLKNKKDFKTVLVNKYFSRFIVLTNDEGPGTLTNIYDEKLNCIYCR